MNRLRFCCCSLSLIFFSLCLTASPRTDTTTYHITLRQETVNKTGRDVTGMTINGTIPGPVLRFNEGDYAVIYVENQMDEETSIHWHGFLLPNFFDGVPYLNTPPIMPGETFKYEFQLRQTGTFWYHSHTMLQEEIGVFAAFVIDEADDPLDYDRDLVLVVSDWTNERPMTILRNLKRGNEWYDIKKGTDTPLNRVIARGALGAQLNFWRQRMGGADISDVAYSGFLMNGEEIRDYPEFDPGERVRLRVINASASSNYWLTFGGGDPVLVSADGLNVEPVRREKTFIAVAETYDFIVTIPYDGQIEFRATVQDGSGTTSAFLGKGDILPATDVQRPDKIGMMVEMAEMDMRMGAPGMKFRPGREEPHEMRDKWGMDMDHHMDDHHDDMDMDDHDMDDHDMDDHDMDDHDMDDHEDMNGMDMFAEFSYDFLRSPESTAFPEDAPVREILLNLTGNMSRYVWSMNGIPLAEADEIRIREGEVIRVVLNNLTMMHHPMHLHGHFFRVLNKHGDHSPLHHTVNVPPMEETTIEFYGDEYGDWLFHCHILYHMMGGMSRIFTYGTPRDPRMEEYPVSKLINESDLYYFWGTAGAASHMTRLDLVSSSIRNRFNLNATYGWGNYLKSDITYERYLYDHLRVLGGVTVRSHEHTPIDEITPTAIAGIRYFTPYMFHLTLVMDNQLRPELRLNRSLMIFPRTFLFGEFEYQADFGWVNDLADPVTGDPASYLDDITWSAGLEFMIGRDLSVTGSYDNRFGFGGGIVARF